MEIKFNFNEIISVEEDFVIQTFNRLEKIFEEVKKIV